MSAATPALPTLRQDLVLLAAAAGADGAPAWLIHDPAQNRFIRIGRSAHTMLALAATGAAADAIIAHAEDRHGERLTVVDIERFAAFLEAQGLTEAPRGGWRALAAQADRRRHGLAASILHNYLFFRVPLFRPDRFLARTLPFVRPLMTRTAALAVIGIGIAGLYLVSRQWDAFVTAAGNLISLEGALSLSLALIVVKMLHELGHAYAAAAAGCRVPVIGAAFVLMTPMLYCDVTDAWRLTSRRARLLIDGAGVIVELALAALATLLWPFLPPGPAQSVAFSIAVVGWVMSVGVNLNPFMRFDGYHIAADLLRVENLQPRAFALGRWRLREALLGLGHAPPERLPPRLLRGLILYAWATWIYRVVVFTGIALAVYHLFFKIAGLALFLVEIIYFLARPVWAELKEWARMRTSLKLNRHVVASACVLAALLAGLALPWSSRVAIPAVLEAAEVQVVFAPQAGEIVAVHAVRGATVDRGTPLVTLAARATAQALREADLRLALVDLRLARRTADAADREDSVVLAEERMALLQRRAGLMRETRALAVSAPIDGDIVEVSPAVHAGRFVGRREPLALVRGTGGLIVRGFVEETDLWRLTPGAVGMFVPDSAERAAIRIELTGIGYAAAASIDRIELASPHGGPIAVRPGAGPGDPLAPAAGQYAATARVLATDAGQSAPPQQAIRGIALIDGARESLLAKGWRQVLRVLVRESGI